MLPAVTLAALLLPAAPDGKADPLTTETGALDAKVFEAYNHCELEKFAGYFDPPGRLLSRHGRRDL